LLQPFCYSTILFCYTFADLHRNRRRRTSPGIFFCSDATLVQKKLLRRLRRGFRQNHFAGKLLRCYISTKNLLQRLRRDLWRILLCFASNRFLLQRSKSGAFFFASRKQFQDFSAKRFCSIYIIFLLQRTIFCYIGTFIETKTGLSEHVATSGPGGSAPRILRGTLSLELQNSPKDSIDEKMWRNLQHNTPHPDKFSFVESNVQQLVITV
jgi:hypothetical protein